MPANSCMPVSNDPPEFAVAVRMGSRTGKVLKRSKTFSLNWLNYSQRNRVKLLSDPNNEADKLRSLKIPSMEVLGAPVLVDAEAYAICEKKSIQSTGDHELVIGGLLGAMASLDFDENWKFREYKPILYLGSSFQNPFSTISKPFSPKK
jgi:flavin reductase (DIM6/NTAB) family NADH-FMN oxidoreductase RutF